MPVEKEVTKLIPKVYKWNAENMGLFFYVKAQQCIVPAVRIEQAILSYFKFVGITVDDWDMDSARATFNRLQNEFYEKVT
jgi:hypothetical protein